MKPASNVPEQARFLPGIHRFPWASRLAIATAFVLLAFHSTPQAATPAATLPPLQVVTDLLRTNLPGWKPDDFNNAAAQALLQRFDAKIIPPGTPDPDVQSTNHSASNSPALANKTRFQESYPYLRFSHISVDLARQITNSLADPQFIQNAKGIIIDLRFARSQNYAAVASAAAPFIRRDIGTLDWGEGQADVEAQTNAVHLPLVVLINSETSGAAEALAFVLRKGASALIIGNTSAGHLSSIRELPLDGGSRLQLPATPIRLGESEVLPRTGIVPDIAVSARTDQERVWIADPFVSPASMSNAVRSAQRPPTASTPRKKTSEADLVRARREGSDPSQATQAPAPVAPSTEPSLPTVRDPVLARGLDILKAVELLKAAR